MAFNTLGTRGFSRVRWEFSVLAEGGHIFGRRPKPRAAKPREKLRAGHYKDLTETGNRARKVSGTQGRLLTLMKSFAWLVSRIVGLRPKGNVLPFLQESKHINYPSQANDLVNAIKAMQERKLCLQGRNQGVLMDF